jgi:hypothetical protein
MKFLLLVLLVSCASAPKPQPTLQPQIVDYKKMFYREYKMTLSNCINYVLDNPSNDVLRLAKADDVAIGKVMDGEILKCLDLNIELMYEEK